MDKQQPMPRCLDKLVKAANAIGATVEKDSDGGRYETIQICAPLGKRWSGGEHNSPISWLTGTKWSAKAKADAIEEGISIIAAGLLDCPTDCECRDQ